MRGGGPGTHPALLHQAKAGPALFSISLPHPTAFDEGCSGSCFTAQVKSLKPRPVPPPPSPGLSCTLTPGNARATLLTGQERAGGAGEQVNVEAAASGGRGAQGAPGAAQLGPQAWPECREGAGGHFRGSAAPWRLEGEIGGREEAGPEAEQERWAVRVGAEGKCPALTMPATT